MKKFLFFLSFIIIFANSAHAQATKKAAAPKTTASKSASAPKFNSKEPSFAGFTGSFIKFGPVSGNARPFTMTVEYAPWFFEIKGTASADYLTQDLGDDAIAVLAYYKVDDSANYQPGLFDLMIYLDDEPIKMSNLSFALIGPATAGSAVLAQAKTWNFTQGQVFKMSKYANGDILTAQATYLDKSHIEREKAAAKKRVADSIAREEKKVKDSIAKEEKRVKDSIAKEKKRVADSVAKEEKKRKDSISAHRRHVRDSIEQEKAEEEARKKAAAATKKKKKRPVVEEAEEEPPRKKRKKKPVIEEEEDDDEPPPPKKKKKRRE